jgi:predicted nucleic acid-binding protein
MSAVFADAVFYLALLNPRDQHAESSTAFAAEYRGQLVTTSEVLTEVANACSGAPQRTLVFNLWKSIENDPNTVIVYSDETLWLQSLELYSDRPDQTWSLTDCMSFLVMRERGITEAATADHHFEQAGFTILLK